MENKTGNNDIIDISGLLRQYANKWYWFVVSVLLCVGVAYAYVKIHKPVYQVNANMLISDNDDSGAVPTELGAFSSIFGGKNSVDDEALILGSHAVMKSTAEELGANVSHVECKGPLGLIKTFLYKDYPLNVEADNPLLVDTLSTSILFKIKVKDSGEVNVKASARGKTLTKVESDGFPVHVSTPYGDFSVVKTSSFKDGESLKMNIIFSGYDVAAEALSEDVTVDIVAKRANMIYLGYKTPYPEYGMKLLNELMAQYNQRGVLEENAKGKKTIEFVDGRIALLVNDLDSIQHEYAAYMDREGIGSVYGQSEFNFKLKGLIDTQLVEAETNVEIVKMMCDFLKNPDNKYSLIPGALDGPNDASIRSYNEMLLKRLELERTASPNNKALKALTEQIDAMRASIVESLNKNYESAVVSLNDLRKRSEGLTGNLKTLPSQEGEIMKLFRERTTKELIFKFLLQQREESAMKIANAISKGVIVDEAYFYSEPLGMSKKLILAIALVIGLLIPPVLIYLYSLLRGKFDTKEEVEKYTSIPILGEVCISKSGDSLVVKPGDNTSSESELFRLIRTNLQFVLHDSSEKVILVTSTSSGEGKSFVSINLASSLSLLGKRTLLVGMDIRAGMLDRYLPLPPSRGLTEYLASTTLTIQDIIIHEPFQKDLDVIVAGPVPPNPSELLAGKRVDQLFADLRELYDYIVVDSAPVGMVSDTFSLSRISDATIYVCRASYTPLRDIKFVNSIYENHRLKRLGLVVNGTKTRKGYGYGYGSSHGSTLHKRK